MRILAVIGSPHKGDCYSAIQKIEKELLAMGDVDFKYLFLKDVLLNQCLGCRTCVMGKGEDYCPLKDDRKQLEVEMLSTDGIILASPVYAGNITGLMKVFFDRFAYTAHRPRFFKQKVLAVANIGSTNPALKRTLQALSFFESSGMQYISKVGIWTPPTKMPDIITNWYDKKLYKGARKLYRAVTLNKPQSPGLSQILGFRFVKVLFFLNKDKIGESDYNYWISQGWFNKNCKYFCNIKVNIIKQMLANTFEIVLRAVFSLVFRNSSSNVENSTP